MTEKSSDQSDWRFMEEVERGVSMRQFAHQLVTLLNDLPE